MNCREKHYQKNDQPYFIMLCNKSRCLIKAWKQRLMCCFFNGSVKSKHQSREQSNTTQNTDNNSLGHYDTHITSKWEGHKAKCDKSGYCCNRTSDYRFEGCIDGMCHSPLFITLKPLLILLITVQQENGIIHGNTKLQDCCQCLSDVWNLTQENITSKIIQDCNTNAEQKQNRNYQRIHCKEQHYQRKAGSNHNVNRHFLKCDLFDISNNACHSTDKTVLWSNLTNLRHSFHGSFWWCCIIKQRDHHSCISVKKCLSQILRKHFYRNGNIQDTVIPQYFFHVINCFDFLFQSSYILQFHILHHYHGKGSHPKLIYHNVLSINCLKGIRQITQYIVVDSGRRHTEIWRDQQCNSDDNDQYLVFCNPLSYLNHLFLLFFLYYWYCLIILWPTVIFYFMECYITKMTFSQ